MTPRRDRAGAGRLRRRLRRLLTGTGRRRISTRWCRPACRRSRSSTPTTLGARHRAAAPRPRDRRLGRAPRRAARARPRSISATGCWSPATPILTAVLRLVLPKGSLETGDPATVRRRRPRAHSRSSDVDYKATIDDPRVIDVTILRPQEIPRYVADGLFDVGVTGRDWIEETSVEVVTLTELHYSKATARPIRMVLAVGGDSPWQSVADLPAGVRVHTEYPELTRRFLEKHGVDARDHAVVRRDRGEDPRDRRRGRRDHRDGPGAARRGAARARHDPRLVHRADRESRRVRRRREAPGDGAAADAAARRARGARPRARQAQRRRGEPRRGDRRCCPRSSRRRCRSCTARTATRSRRSWPRATSTS